ncbi:MAG: hypothetical protein IH848_02935 [Acidobacteria bacterium]|nr:hypothetical protein [Acidobacteriota bacterium]
MKHEAGPLLGFPLLLAIVTSVLAPTVFRALAPPIGADPAVPQPVVISR